MSWKIGRLKREAVSVILAVAALVAVLALAAVSTNTPPGPPSSGPCAELIEATSDPRTSDDVKLAALSDVEPRIDNIVPAELRVGSVYCWDTVPAIQGEVVEELLGVAVTDHSASQLWFVRGTGEDDVTDWKDLISELTGLELESTEYGLRSTSTP